MRIHSLLLLLALSSVSHSLFAADFGWLDSLSVSASSNQSGFNTRLGVRFHLGGAELQAVVRDSGGPADAYMVLRLAEISHQPRQVVIREYRQYRKAKAWGKLARKLGIKPGSKEFHALKNGHDLGDWNKGHMEQAKGGEFHENTMIGAPLEPPKSHHFGGGNQNMHKKGNKK